MGQVHDQSRIYGSGGRGLVFETLIHDRYRAPHPLISPGLRSREFLFDVESQDCCRLGTAHRSLGLIGGLVGDAHPTAEDQPHSDGLLRETVSSTRTRYGRRPCNPASARNEATPEPGSNPIRDLRTKPIASDRNEVNPEVRTEPFPGQSGQPGLYTLIANDLRRSSRSRSGSRSRGSAGPDDNEASFRAGTNPFLSFRSKPIFDHAIGPDGWSFHSEGRSTPFFGKGAYRDRGRQPLSAARVGNPAPRPEVRRLEVVPTSLVAGGDLRHIWSDGLHRVRPHDLANLVGSSPRRFGPLATEVIRSRPCIGPRSRSNRLVRDRRDLGPLRLQILDETAMGVGRHPHPRGILHLHFGGIPDRSVNRPMPTRNLGVTPVSCLRTMDHA